MLSQIPELPAGSAGQIVTVDLALNGSDYTGTKVSFEFYERVVLKSVHPPLTPWTVAVPITVRLSGLVASKHVLALIWYGSSIENTYTLSAPYSTESFGSPSHDRHAGCVLRPRFQPFI